MGVCSWDAFPLVKPPDVKYGDDIDRLAPSEEEILGVPTKPTESRLQASVEFSQASIKEEPIGMPVTSSLLPGPCLRRQLHLTTEVSAAVVKACRMQSVSSTSAWHAVTVLATQNIQQDAVGHRPGTNWCSFTNFDLWNHFHTDSSPRRTLLASFKPYPFRIERSAERRFDEISRGIQHD